MEGNFSANWPEQSKLQMQQPEVKLIDPYRVCKQQKPCVHSKAEHTSTGSAKYPATDADSFCSFYYTNSEQSHTC